MPLISPPWVASNLMPRTQSPLGTLRSFIRVDSFYGSNGSAALGSLGSQATTFNTTAGTSASRETTLVSRAFVQFVGLTAGRTQSMFDFYADAINFKSLRGSNAIVTLFRLYGNSRQRFLWNALL